MKIGKQTEVLYANKGTKRRRKGQKKEGRTHRRPPSNYLVFPKEGIT